MSGIDAGAGNLFADVTPRGAVEIVSELARAPGLRIERIVSTGQASPADGSWYDQDWAEWVVLIAGAADILFQDEAASRRLKPGDHLLIAAHRRHRVTWTDPENPTIWLAVHFGSGAEPLSPRDV